MKEITEAIESKYAAIRSDIAIVLDGFGKGVFIRSTENDSDPGWAIKLMPYLTALGRLAKELE